MKPLVLQLPGAADGRNSRRGLTPAQEELVYRQLGQWIESISRPGVVLDCAGWDEMGVRRISLLLSCLERVMKRNGDVRLAGVSPKARESLSFAGVERLFRIYDSSDLAIRSFDSHPIFETYGETRFGGAAQPGADDERVISPSSFRHAVVRKLGGANENREKQIDRTR